MDFFIYSFIEYGWKPKELKKYANKIHFVDLFRPNNRLLNYEYRNLIQESGLTDFIINNQVKINESILDSLYLLAYYQIDINIIEELVNVNCKTISKFQTLKDEEFQSILGSNHLENVLKIEHAINQYSEWKKENSESLIELVVVDILEKEKIDELGDLMDSIVTELLNTYTFPNRNVIRKVLISMMKNKIIERKNNVYQLVEMTAKNLFKLNLKQDDILFQGLKGVSIQDMAFRQKVNMKAIIRYFRVNLKHLPLLIEDYKYSVVFRKYNFSETEFCTLFNEDKYSYNYLKLKYQAGSKDIYEYFVDFSISKSYYIRFLKKIQKYDYEFIELSSITHQSIFDFFISKNKAVEINYIDGMRLYNEFISPYNLTRYPENKLSEFIDLVSSSNYTVRYSEKSFRYYDLLTVDPEEVQMIRALFDLPKGVYGGQKIFDLNSDLMEQLGLENAFELLDLINKLNISSQEQKILIYNQEVQIGDLSKTEFIKNQMLEFNLKTIDVFVEDLFFNYGLSKEMTTEYIFNNFSEYIFDNKIQFRKSEVLEKSMHKKLKAVLVENIYLANEINHYINKKFKVEIVLTNEILNKIGYKLHRRFIMKTKFLDPRYAIKMTLLEKNRFTLPNTELTKDSLFYSVRNSLEKDLKLFRFNKDVYITFDLLRKAGIREYQIINFIDSVYDFMVKNNGFYTFYKLINEGFEHELIEMGFGSIFYENILNQSNHLNRINKTPTIYYIQDDNPKKLKYSDFLYQILLENRSLDYQQFINDLHNDYGIEQDVYNLKYQLSNTTAYFSEETEKYYYEKEYYYQEVYGK